jgi:ATP-dependent DNA helicase RecG
VVEALEQRFAARNQETEVEVGLIRLPVPDYAPESLREAVNNALLHRDYSRLEGIYIQWHPDHVLIASPGPFPSGVTTQNILVHEPKPRNPRLAESFRRIGLVEQTGRGVDRIYLGQLRYGRPVPDYSRSDSEGVRVVLPGGKPSLEFAALVYEENRVGRVLTLDELMVLNALFYERQTDSTAVGALIQKGATAARAVLERLVERGLLEARGDRRGRAYMLSAALYRRLHQEVEYVRARGFEPLQREQMVLNYARNHGGITRSEVADLCQLTPRQAGRVLSQMVHKYPEFQMTGTRRWARYEVREGG